MKRIAMWSGPRNISTAMMRAWENRGDTYVTDEPLYACYLKITGIEHPGRNDILASMSSDWKTVTKHISTATPDNRKIWYQKHMTHHLLDGQNRKWLDDLIHAFLIRKPEEVALSYARVREQPTPEDLGFPQQTELFDRIANKTGTPPPVIDARDVLEKPERPLKALCQALEVPFTDKMLHWPKGPRDSDGIWAKFWYASVEASEGFAPYTPTEGIVPEHLKPVVAACRPYYEKLVPFRL